MAVKAPFTDRVVIVLIAAGIVMLGADGLVRSERLAEIVDRAGSGEVFKELREDFSSQLAEGATAEELSPQSDQERRARYPWKLEVKQEKDIPQEESILERMEDALWGEDEDQVEVEEE